MKNLFMLTLVLCFSLSALADERACEKQCRTEYQSCLDKAFLIAEDEYIDIEVEAQWLSNKKIDDLHDAASKHLKGMKKTCRKERDTCKKSCNQD